MDNVLYTRVSTNSQGEDSLEFQSVYCYQYLEDKGQHFSKEVSEVGSGFNGSQKKLVDLIDNNKNINIYVKNVNRFCRNVVFGLNLIDKASKNNIIINFIEENIRSNDESTKHILRTKLSEAQHESELISRRQKDSFKVKKAMGWKFGKPVFGKKSEIVNGIRIQKVNLEEKKIIDFICQAREGKSKHILNIKLKKINPDLPPIRFWDKDGTEIDEFSKPCTLNYLEISDLLNDYEIKNRDNKKWTRSSVNRVYTQQKKIIENQLAQLSFT